jgi:hypothetical protein
VRTHFDRLRRDKLITAERDHGNGPWRYELPEELTESPSPFNTLPPAQELNVQRENDQGDTCAGHRPPVSGRRSGQAWSGVLGRHTTLDRR